jgi:photosystem II stability/assembly factor-like uncharacterized protein
MSRYAWLSPNGVDTCQLDGPPHRLLVATMNGVIDLERPVDGAGPWNVGRQRLRGHHVGSLMMIPGTDLIFAGTHGSGLYRSKDAGDSWQPVTRGMNLPTFHIFSLAFTKRGDDVILYAGTEPARLFESTDLGDHWQELTAMRQVPSASEWNFPAPPHIAHVKHITTDPRDPDTIYVCVEQGALLKSSDGGASWSELEFEDEMCRLNKDTHRVVFNPADADDIFVDGGDGLFRSRDAGGTWSRVTDTTLRIAYPDQLYFDPEVSKTIFVVGGGTAPPAWRQTGRAEPAIIRSIDDGASWQELTQGMDHDFPGNFEASAMVTWPGGYGFFIGTSDGEVLASFDKGESWTEIASDLAPVSKCIHFRNLAVGRAAAAAADEPV